MRRRAPILRQVGLLSLFLAAAVTTPAASAATDDAVATTGCWALDGISAIQVEVTRNAKLGHSNSSDVQVRVDPKGKRNNEYGGALPYAQIRQGPKDPEAEGKEVNSRDIVHTRGHFNSFIAILVFTCLTIIAIFFYCWRVVVGTSGSEEEVVVQEPEPQPQATGVPPSIQRIPSIQHLRSQSKLRTGGRARSSSRDTGRDGDGDGEDPYAPQRSMSGLDMGRPGAKSGDPHVAKLRSFLERRRKTWADTTKAWGDKRWTMEEGHGTMSAFAFVVNIIADLCPSGLLSIAYGMDGTGYLWCLFLMIVFCALCCYTMWACGRTSEITGESDFASQWSLVIGTGGSWIPLLVIVIVAFGALLCYACYFGDLLEEVMPSLGLHLPRYACLISFSIFPALPLCLLKNLSALAYSSFFAVIAIFYTAVVMCWRLADGSYAPGGLFYEQIPASSAPRHPTGGYMVNIGPRSLLFINILAMAFHCHCNACKYYRELQNTTPRHFRNCCVVAMGLSAVIYIVIGFAGFKTFGSAAHGTILENYSMKDTPVNLARLLISLSLAASYAIMFSALREAFLGLLKRALGAVGNSLDHVWRQDVISVILVALVTVCGVISQDSGLVDGFVGAFCGNAIIYIIPCVLYTAAIRSFLVRKRNKPGLAFASCLVILGVILAIAGCVCLVIFEVEVHERRPVYHHWHVPTKNDTLLPLPKRKLEGHHKRPWIRHFYNVGTRPHGRTIWAMR